MHKTDREKTVTSGLQHTHKIKKFKNGFKASN